MISNNFDFLNAFKKSPLLALLNSRLRRGFGGQAKRLEISPKNGWRARVAHSGLRPSGSKTGEPMTSFPNWRKREDSNPRGPFGPTAFRVRRIRPLCHASIKRQVPL